MTLLVQDGVDRDRRLAGLAVTDDELALSTTDGRHRVDGLDAGLQRLADGLATGDAGGLDLHAAKLGVDERALAVNGLTEGVHDSSEQRVADGHRQNAPGRANDLLFFDAVHRAEHDRADRLLVEVHGKSHGAVFELEKLVHLRRGQPRHARDAVADFDDAPDLLGRDGRIEVGDVLAQCLSDLAGANGELSHHIFLFLVVS